MEQIVQLEFRREVHEVKKENTIDRVHILCGSLSNSAFRELQLSSSDSSVLLLVSRYSSSHDYHSSHTSSCHLLLVFPLPFSWTPPSRDPVQAILKTFNNHYNFCLYIILYQRNHSHDFIARWLQSCSTLKPFYWLHSSRLLRVTLWYPW